MKIFMGEYNCRIMWNFNKIPLSLRIKDTIENTFDGICQRKDNVLTRKIFSFFKTSYHNSIIRILNENQGEIFRKYESSWTNGEQVENPPIFVFWYQGFNNAPPVVKCYHNALLRHCGKHPVITVDKENVSDLIDLPSYIYEKLDERIITLTHFSDIVRFSLLEKYGGLWLDGTILTTKDIDEKIFSFPYFTLRVDASERQFTKFLGLNRWCGFCCGGYKGSSLFSAMKELFLSYWDSNNVLLDYFLIDIYMECLYRCNAHMRELIDACTAFPREKIFFIAENLYEDFSQNIVEKYKRLNPSFSKCTYKLKEERIKENCLIERIIETDALCLE